MFKLLREAILISGGLHPKASSEGCLTSVTSLISPPQQTVLKTRHNPPQDPEKSQKAFLGSAFHAYVERLLRENARDIGSGHYILDDIEMVFERRWKIEVNGEWISGAADLLWRKVGEQGWNLVDYKTTSAYSIKARDKERGEWRMQLNIYSEMCESKDAMMVCDGGGWRKNEPLEVVSLAVVAVAYDWRPSDAKKQKGYPKTDSVEISIPLRPHAKRVVLLEEKVGALVSAFKKEDSQLPKCEDVWEDWRSGEPKRCMQYCNAKDVCCQHKKWEKENG